MTTNDVLHAVWAERDRQRTAARQGRLLVDCAGLADDFLKLPVLAEEFGEVAKALHEDNGAGLYDELIQVAAVAVAWAESLR